VQVMARRTIIAVGLLGLSVASIALEKPQTPVPTPSKSAQQEKPTTKQNQIDSTDRLPQFTSPLPVEVASPTYILQSAPEDKADNKRNYASPEWGLVYVTVVLVVATIGLMVYTARLWKATKTMASDANKVAERQAGEVQQSLAIARESTDAAKQAAEISQRALVASNRAWVKVDIIPGGPIAYSDNGVAFPFNFKVINIGRSPAVNVWVSPSIILTYPGGAIDPAGEVMKVIQQHKGHSSASLGFTLFPNDFALVPIITHVTQEELRRATAMFGAIYPHLIGVVVYLTGLDEEAHQTSFNLEIRRPDTPRPYTTAGNKWHAAIWVEEGDVPQSEIRLLRSPVMSGYAD
jgi:hypothetical protein